MITSLEEKVADMADKLVESKREADKYLQAGLTKELAEGLSILETAKFEKLAEMVSFDRSSDYMDKLEVIKEQIISVRVEDFAPEGSAELPAQAFRADKAVDVKAATDFSRYV